LVSDLKEWTPHHKVRMLVLPSAFAPRPAQLGRRCARLSFRILAFIGVAALFLQRSPAGALSVQGTGDQYTKLTDVPPRLNESYHSSSSSEMLKLFGQPGPLTTDCSRVTNGSLKNQVLTQSVGPFRVTGLRPAIAALDRIFRRVRADRPDLYRQLGTAGMLCVRAIRGSSSSYSNHSWGTAIDITINGTLLPQGSKQTLRGLLLLYPYFHAEGFYWGAGFSGDRRDPMHFEASAELAREWARALPQPSVGENGFTYVPGQPIECKSSSGFGRRCTGSVTIDVRATIPPGTRIIITTDSLFVGAQTVAHFPPGRMTFPLSKDVLTCPPTQSTIYVFRGPVVNGPPIAKLAGVRLSVGCQ
jgi:D-alanyl-D-alanine carboxypeptidase-like protein